MDEKKNFKIQIARPLDTCNDEQQNYIINPGTTNLLIALIARKDFQKLKYHNVVKMNVKRRNLI